MIKSAVQEAQELSDKLGFALLPIGKVPATDYFLDFFAKFLMANGFEDVEVRTEWEKSLFPIVTKAEFKVGDVPQEEEASWHVQLSKDEYYLICILVGHLIPNNGITGSLLDKFNLDLECRDYDRLEFVVNVVNNQADVQMKLNEFNLENK